MPKHIPLLRDVVVHGAVLLWLGHEDDIFDRQFVGFESDEKVLAVEREQMQLHAREETLALRMDTHLH